MDERGLELKVGALALVALAIGAALVLGLTGLLSGEKATLYADFGYAGGIPAGAQVKIAGVKVGRVEEVHFLPEARDATGRPTPVRLELGVDPKAIAALREDALATVSQQGALGESHLELLPGTSPERLAAGAPLPGLDPPRLDVVLARLASVLESAANDDAFRLFLVEVGKIAKTLDSVLTSHGDDFGRLFTNLSALVEDGRGAVTDVRVAAKSASRLLGDDDLRKLVADLAVTARSAREELPPLLTEARGLVARLDGTASEIKPEDIAKVRATLDKLDSVAARLQQVSDGAGAILAGIQRGEGTAGRLVKDPKVYDDLRALLDDLKSHPWKLVWKN